MILYIMYATLPMISTFSERISLIMELPVWMSDEMNFISTVMTGYVDQYVVLHTFYPIKLNLD